MSSKKWNEDYINYNDYSFFKTYFKTERDMTDGEQENLKTINEQLRNESYDKINVKHLFELLIKYLNTSHVMYDCRSDNCCRYVNYDIAKKVRDNNYVEYIESNFNIFKKFMKEYYNASGSRNCKDRLDYIDPVILSRMDILYNLYNKYYELISLISYDPKKQLCTTLSLVVREYKEAIKKHGGDENFIKQLEKLRDLILSKSSKYHSECQWNLSPTTLPEPVTSHQEEIQKVQEKQLNSDVPKQQSSHNELENRRTVVSASDESELSGPAVLQQQYQPSRDVQPLSTYPHSDQSHSAHSEPTHSRPVQLEPEGSQTEDLQVTQVTSMQPSRYEWQKPDVLEHIDQKTYTPKYPNNAPEHRDGVLGKMQVFFTDTLGQVDPGPVLGVSGGMGALFLLFKYTPVGSFFGGRRGRIRQIPSSFRGFPPDFANFQEYDGGFIGYGPMNINPLAE